MKKILLLFLNLSFIISAQNIYQYETCILTPSDNFELKQDIKNIAYNFNKTLGLSKFFDTSKLVNNRWIRQELKKDSTHSEEEAITLDKQIISYSFFNRDSDTLILVGPGFTNCKEKMAPFAHMFLDYDVAILNFRGHGHSDNFKINPLYHLTGIDSNVKLGASEENDVFAVINNLQHKKTYKKIIGLGICFGAFIFVKAQAIAQEKNEKLFDKLILDGCWLSLDATKEKIFKDPYLIISPQKGGAPSFLKKIFGNEKFKQNLEWSIEKLFDIKFAHINLKKYLKQINIPTLFFYGKHDLMIRRDEFNKIWNYANSQERVAVITDNPHVHNHLRSKELYKLICDTFIQNKYQTFINYISNPEELRDAITKDLKTYATRSFNDYLKPVKIVKQRKFPYWTLLLIPAMIYGGIKLFYKK
jgi:pimeloyl-ACP methyl ester carboxylesterase